MVPSTDDSTSYQRNNKEDDGLSYYVMDSGGIQNTRYVAESFSRDQKCFTESFPELTVEVYHVKCSKSIK